MSEETKVEVSKIEIKIGDTKVSITPSQLKELRDVLESLFPKKTQFIPSAPIYIERPYHPWRQWDVICKSSGTLCLEAS